MKELELKYGCNPNQKPSRIYMENGELPNQGALWQTGLYQFSGCIQRLAARVRVKKGNRSSGSDLL